MTDLTGKIAVVTGAGSGIGAATAAIFAARGARVCCADIDEAASAATADKINADGGEAFSLRVDVGEESDNELMVEETVRRFGRLHVAFLNAGTGHQDSVVDFPLEQWDRTMAVNLRGAFLGLKASARAIVAGGDSGSIVITSSAAGIGGVQNASAYSASKHGVIGLAKSAALDLAGSAVRVNAVCPGFIGSNEGIRGMAEQMNLARKMPLGRIGASEDVGHLVAFLASDDASYITGTVFSIDGGVGAGTRVLK